MCITKNNNIRKMALPIIALTSLIGYYLNKNDDKNDDKNEITKKINNPKLKNYPKPYEIPNGKYIYSSNNVNEANSNILNKSLDLYKQAEDPALTGVLPPLFNTYSIRNTDSFEFDTNKKLNEIDSLNRLVDVAQKQKEPDLQSRPMFNSEIKYKGEVLQNNFTAFEQTPISQEISLLTGKPLEREHTNMVPFFGSNVKQNIETFTNQSILDLHSGNTSTFKHKKEIGQFFESKQENIYGTPLFTNEIQTDRFISSLYRQGEKPFLEEKIAAPISGTYDNKILPSYKDVNELRPGNKPKDTYEGRTLAGQMGEVRGVQASVNKNRPDTYYEQGQDRLIVTTGQHIAKKADEDFSTNFKTTSRQDYNMEYYGPIGSSEFLNSKQRLQTIDIDNSGELNFNSSVQIPKRQNFENDYLRNVSTEKRVHDYGKNTITNYETERATTEDKSHLLNVNSSTRGIKVSFSDEAKSTIKETTLDTDTVRNFKSSFDRGLIETHYSGISDFKARTTNKETFGEDNYKGITNKEKGMGYLVNKYDAKTTGKEIITDESEYQGNAKYANNPMSNQNYKNAVIRDSKEELLERDRSSGPQNFQIHAGKYAFGNLKFTENMKLKESIDERDKLNVIKPNIFPSKMSIGISDRVRYDDDIEDTVFADRIQSDLVSVQLNENPYSIYRKK